MFIKYNSFDNELNEKHEHRLVLQSIEDAISMLRANKERNEDQMFARRPDKKLLELVREKKKLRTELYTV